MLTLREIILRAERMNKKERMLILQMMHAMGVKVHEGGDGSRINLSDCSAVEIGVLSNFIEHMKPIEAVNRI